MDSKKTTIQLYEDQLQTLEMALNIAENWLYQQFHMVGDGNFYSPVAGKLEDSYYDVHLLSQALKDGSLTERRRRRNKWIYQHI